MKRILLSIITITAFGFGANAQIVNIPDANFKAYLVGNSAINTNADTEIQVSEASAFTGLINCPSLGINDLTGVEEFTAISTLYCYSNSLTSLDVTQNTALTNLQCFSNSLTSLDITQNTSLTNLYCHSNSLITLDVTQNVALIQLKCSFNLLTSLDVTQNTALIDLYCTSNSLSTLDVSSNPYLTDLQCNGNSLTSLNINNNTSLIKLFCQNNSISNLNVNNNLALNNLRCFSNLLSNLNISNNTSLIQLYCEHNSLTNLDISSNVSLTSLACNNNLLTSLNVANGNNSNMFLLKAHFNPNLTCIQVDNVNYSTTNWTTTSTSFIFDATASFSTNCSVGIDEQANNIILSLYPNPVNNQMTIEIEEQIESILIMDVMGKTVKTITSTNNTIDVSDLTKGIYFLQIQTNKGLVSKKFIKE